MDEVLAAAGRGRRTEAGRSCLFKRDLPLGARYHDTPTLDNNQSPPGQLQERPVAWHVIGMIPSAASNWAGGRAGFCSSHTRTFGSRSHPRVPCAVRARLTVRTRATCAPRACHVRAREGVSTRLVVKVPLRLLRVLGGREHVTLVVLRMSLDRRGRQHRQQGLAELVDRERRRPVVGQQRHADVPWSMQRVKGYGGEEMGGDRSIARAYTEHVSPRESDDTQDAAADYRISDSCQLSSPGWW